MEKTSVKTLSKAQDIEAFLSESNNKGKSVNVTTSLFDRIDDISLTPEVRDFTFAVFANGITESILCTWANDKKKLVATDGRKRLFAAQLFKLKTVPVIITTEMAGTLSAVTRYARFDRTVVEKAEDFARAKEQDHISSKELAMRLGQTEASVSGYLKIAALLESIRNEIRHDSRYTLTELLKIARRSPDEQQEQFNLLKGKKNGDKSSATTSPNPHPKSSSSGEAGQVDGDYNAGSYGEDGADVSGVDEAEVTAEEQPEQSVNQADASHQIDHPQEEADGEVHDGGSNGEDDGNHTKCVEGESQSAN